MTLESQNLLFPRVCCGSLVLLLWAVSVLEISLRYKLKVLLCLFLEKEMAAHSSVLVWRIPGMAEPVGCCPWGCTEPDTTEATSLPLFTFMYWRRKWQPTPVFLPGESQGQGSLVACHLWGHTELDTTERLHFHFSLYCIGEGNGRPLQCSCLENPRDGGAWWPAIYGVVQSRTRLK